MQTNLVGWIGSLMTPSKFRASPSMDSTLAITCSNPHQRQHPEGRCHEEEHQHECRHCVQNQGGTSCHTPTCLAQQNTSQTLCCVLKATPVRMLTEYLKPDAPSPNQNAFHAKNNNTMPRTKASKARSFSPE